MTDAPERIAPILDCLGEDATLDFLLQFGGTPVYLGPNPRPGSDIVQCLGYDQAARLGKALGPGQVHIPSLKKWVAGRLDAKGWTGIQIARALHADNRTVRRWLNGYNEKQLDLFLSKQA